MGNPIWSRLKYFKESEAWGDSTKMDDLFLLQLDRFRDNSGYPFEVNVGYATSGHVKDSYHYEGRAVDGRFLDPISKKPLPLITQLIIAMKSPFGGLGFYTWWPRGPGVHLDNRDSTEHRSIWISKSEGIYEPLTASFLNDISKESLS